MSQSLEQSILSQPTYKAGLLQSKAYRVLSDFLTGQLKAYNITLSEWKLLGHLFEAESMTPSDIGELLSVRMPICTRLLNSLQHKGLISRRQDETDNRVNYADITIDGQRLVTRIEGQLRHEMEQFLSDIPRQDLEAYVRVLARLAHKLQ